MALKRPFTLERLSEAFFCYICNSFSASYFCHTSPHNSPTCTVHLCVCVRVWRTPNSEGQCSFCQLPHKGSFQVSPGHFLSLPPIHIPHFCPFSSQAEVMPAFFACNKTKQHTGDVGKQCILWFLHLKKDKRNREYLGSKNIVVLAWPPCICLLQLVFNRICKLESPSIFSIHKLELKPTIKLKRRVVTLSTNSNKCVLYQCCISVCLSIS